eukprot:403373-Prymnesium_polylepis.1
MLEVGERWGGATSRVGRTIAPTGHGWGGGAPEARWAGGPLCSAGRGEGEGAGQGGHEAHGGALLAAL